MPFTLMHPAPVIFLKNKYLRLSALILGSMAPDFIYFILFSPSSNIGHTFFGCMILNLPLCFFMNAIMNGIVKNPFINHLPHSLWCRYQHLTKVDSRIKDVKDAIIFTYSALIGMATHVIWDAFTHKTGYFVVRIKVLQDSINFKGFEIPLYKILQHGSSIVGMVVILIFLFKIAYKTDIKPIRVNRGRYYSLMLLSLIVVLLGSFLFTGYTNRSFGIGRLVVSTINGMLIGSLVAGIDYRKRRRCSSSLDGNGEWID